MASRPRVGDLIEVAPIPAVLALADAARLRDELAAGGERLAPRLRTQLEALLGGYLVERPDNRATCDALLGSLASPTGRAFFVRGVYGSGKTHLLSVLALLCEREAAWPVFLASHPEYDSIARAVGRRRWLVVPIALDEFRASGRALEDIVFEETERQLARPAHGAEVTLSDAAQAMRLVEQFALPKHRAAFDAYLRRAAAGATWEELRERDPQRAGTLARRFADRIGLPAGGTRSRADAFAAALDAVERARLRGIVLLLDELGLFLSTKTRRELNEDASFLQFLAQRTRRSPLWLVAAIQRQIEEVGGIDAYSLRQIKDRFVTCTLDTAQLRTVLSRKVIVRRDPDAFAPEVAEIWRAYGAQPGFSRDDLALSYPLNPLAFDLLEALADSVLSKTRSLLQFVQAAAQPDTFLRLPAHRLLTPDVVFRHFRDQMAGLPELRSHLAAHRFLAEHLRRIGAGHPALAMALIDTLTLLSVADLRWPVRDLADALIGSAAWAQAGPESPQAFRQLVARELEGLRRRGAYLEMVRSADPGAEQYFLDVTSDVSEVIRRRINQIADAFERRDGRVLAEATAACAQPAFPLASFTEPRAAGFEWMASRRTAAVLRRDLAALKPEDLSNMAALLESPHCREDAHLIAAELGDTARQLEAWQRAAAGLPGRAGLVAWIPREPTQAEWQELAEQAALRMLANDPSLSGRRGSEARRRARERLGASTAEVAGLVARLYYEGRVLDPAGQPVTEAGALDAAKGDWEATLAAILSPSLGSRFPRFASVAPRRVLARAHVTQIIDHFIRPGQVTLPPGAGLEAHLNDFVRPLGFVAEPNGTHTLRISAGPLVAFITSQVPEPAGEPLDAGQLRAFGDLVGLLAKSEFGLTPEQSELAIACLVRAGHLVALDAFCQPLSFDRIGTPLGDHVAFLTRAQLLDADTAAALADVSQAVLGRRPRRLDLSTQQRLWEDVLAWKRRTLEQAPRLNDALERLTAALGHQPVQWSGTRRALDRAAQIADPLDDTLTARDGLTVLVAALSEGDMHLLKTFAQARAFLLEDAGAIAAAHAFVTDARFQVMPESLLVSQRRRLLGWVERAEGMLSQRTRARRAAAEMLRTYANEYLAWHRQVHTPQRFARYAALRQGDAYRALAVVSASGVDGGEALRHVEGAIQEQMARHCPGSDLEQALASSPVCPQCGLRLGDTVELTQPSRIEQTIRASLQRLVGMLHESDVEKAIEQGLAAETDARAAAAVRRAMKLPPTAEPAAMNRVFTREAAAWISQCLRRRPVGKRRLDDLIALLANKRLSKREAAEAFGRWLDTTGDLANDDVIEIL